MMPDPDPLHLDASVGSIVDVIDELPAPAQQAAPAGTPRSLAGMRFGVKEVIDVAGAPVRFGSRVFADRVATTDAPVITRLRAAGAIPVAMTRAHEFCWGITTQGDDALGSTRNPWDLRRSPGGSSGGSAAAVALGIVPAALGTDTGGSVRIPAAACGVVGFKPTFAAVPIEGVCPLAPSLDHVGVLARTIADAWQLLQVMAGAADPEPLASTSATPGTVGVLSPEPPGADAARTAALDRAAAALEDAGWRIRRLEPDMFASAAAIYAPIQGREAYETHTRTLATFPARRRAYGRQIADRLDHAGRIRPDDVERARTERRDLVDRLDRLLATQVDVLLSPVTATAPGFTDTADVVELHGAPVAWRDAALPHTALHDLAGTPAVAIPAGIDPDGLPISVQLAAGRHQDRALAHVARDLEAALGWDQRLAPMAAEQPHPGQGPDATGHGPAR